MEDEEDIIMTSEKRGYRVSPVTPSCPWSPLASQGPPKPAHHRSSCSIRTTLTDKMLDGSQANSPTAKSFVPMSYKVF